MRFYATHMVIIRLARRGSKKRPFYDLTVADSRNKRDGRFLEKIGYFNPIARGKEIRLHINNERAEYWVSQGAQLSDRVKSLLKEDRLGVEKAALLREKKLENRKVKRQKAKAEKAAESSET